jgi:hypothetical protein
MKKKSPKRDAGKDEEDIIKKLIKEKEALDEQLYLLQLKKELRLLEERAKAIRARSPKRRKREADDKTFESPSKKMAVIDLSDPPIDFEAVDNALRALLDRHIESKDYEGMVSKTYATKNIVETGGAGDCLFYSLAHELRRLGYEADHKTLRAKVCDVLEHFVDNFDGIGNVFFNRVYAEAIEDEIDEVTANGHILRLRSKWNIKSIRDYIKDMRKQGTWAGELEIFAAHLLYHDINLFVLKKNRNKNQFYDHYSGYVGSDRTIRLYNKSHGGQDNHFQVLRDDRDSGRSNLKGNSRRRKPCVNTI